jgi:FlaA1/EpsC-like NDP-sugar epimerase
MKQRTLKALEFFLRFRRMLAVVFQLLLVALSNKIAFWLRFDSGVPDWANLACTTMLPWLIATRGLMFIPFRLYQGLWRYTSIADLEALIGGVTSSSIVFWLITRSSLGPPSYPRSIIIIDALILTILLGGLRMTRRLYAEYSRGRAGKTVLVVGAGDAGELIVRDMRNNAWYGFQPIGFIDDDRDKVGRRIHNVPVLGTRADLPEVIDRYDPDEVLIAIPRADPATVRDIVRSLEPFKLPIKTLPNLRDIIDGRVEVGIIRKLEVADLLQRAPIGLDAAPLRQLIARRRVMVTGAGGSIGSELCRQILTFKPASLVLFERYENSLHAIRMELQDAYGSALLRPVVGDVTDRPRVDEVLAAHRPDIIFHAAAHKHVPLMEENPCEAIKNNVAGTRLMAEAAERHGVDRFIMISTDKAVNPTSVMGASKRIAELVVQSQAEGSHTSFSIVRFGNVLASNGSVVPRFMDQIKRGGPVTITHPDMRRFFMLIPEAVQLVLHAAAQAESGATYVLEMGEQIRLVDMARDLIRLSGLVPDEDIKIEFIGLRPGEKLFEELVGRDEEAAPSTVDKILCVRNRRRPRPHLVAVVEQLEMAARAGQRDAVLAAMNAIVGAVDRGVDPLPAPEPAVSLAALSATPFDRQACPRCKTGFVHRSRVKNVFERVRKGFTAERLYRCEACEWRGWLTPVQIAPPVPVDTPSPPDLESLDLAESRRAAYAARPTFSPRDLQ